MNREISALSGLPRPLAERGEAVLEHVHLHQRLEGAVCRQSLEDLAVAVELTPPQLASVIEELARRGLFLRHNDAWALSCKALSELRAREAAQ